MSHARTSGAGPIGCDAAADLRQAGGFRPFRHASGHRPVRALLAGTILSSLIALGSSAAWAGTCNGTAGSATASGGAGGSAAGAAGGAGGADCTSQPGGSGTATANGLGGGGGGGAGGTGGTSGSVGGAGAGGAGATVPGAPGAGNGGAGGLHGTSLSGSVTLSNSITGGNGAAGGNAGGSRPAGGGGGGGGGYGILFSGTSLTLLGGANIVGGNGGNGGGGVNGGSGGNGGAGGADIFFTGPAILNNAGTIRGGTGGTAGSGGQNGFSEAGIVGSNLTIVNSGTIAGGFVPGGGAVVNAIVLTGGTNSLSLTGTGSLSGGIYMVGSLAVDVAGAATTNLGANPIAGSGSLAKTGTGLLILSGSDSYSGGTTVQAGTLQLGGAGSLGTGVVTVASGAVLNLHGFSPTIPTLSGGGTIEATGANTTSVLSVASGSFSGIIRDRAPGNGDTSVVALTKISDGTATGGTFALSGDNSYSGGTVVQAGILQVGGRSVIAGGNITSSPIGTGALSLQGGTLQAGSDLTLANGATIGSSGARFDSNGFTLTYAGSIGGAGALTKSGAGTLILSGNNTYAGGTTITDGTLRFETPAAIAGSGANVTIAAGGIATTGYTLDQSVLARVAPASRGVVALSGPSSATLDFGAAGLSGVSLGAIGSQTFSGTLRPGTDGLYSLGGGGGTLTLATALGGTAGLSVDGHGTSAGTVVLTRANGLSGAVSVTGGTLQIGASDGSGGSLTGAASMTNAASVVVAAGGSATFTGEVTSSGSLTVAGTLSTPVLTNSGTLAFQAPAAAAIGTLNQQGGSVDLGGLNLTAGQLNLTGGTIDRGTLTVNGGAGGFALQSGAVSATLAGSAGLAKTGAGTVTLSGVNTYTGPTTIGAGTLALTGQGSIAASSGVQVEGRLDIAQSAQGASIAALSGTGRVTLGAKTLTIGTGSGSFSGTIAGAGGLVLDGGSLALSGASTYAGGTFLRAGTLTVGSDTALGTGPVTMKPGSTLAFSGGDIALANAVALVDTGDPTIDTGSGTVTLAGPLSGSGTLSKAGSGILTLNGTSSFSGPTTVLAGTLAVNGFLGDSDVQVGPGAVLAGSGAVGSVVVGNGGTLAPGAIQTGANLKVLGSLTLAHNSTLLVGLQPGGIFDSVAVAGTARLQGGALVVDLAPGSFDLTQPIPILTASGGLKGTFGQITTNDPLAFLKATPVYGPNGITLRLDLVNGNIASVAVTPNQQSVAGAIATLPSGNALLKAVLSQTAGGAREALDAASGSVQASATAAEIQTSRYISTYVVDRLFTVAGSSIDARQLLDQLSPNLPTFVNCYAAVPERAPLISLQHYTMWGEGFGNFGHTDGNAGASALDRSLGGFVLGIDTPLQGLPNPYRIGVAGGYTNDHYSTKPSGSSGTAESVFGSLYGSARFGAVDVRLGASYAANSTRATRSVTFPGFAETEASNYGGYTVQGFGELGYRFSSTRLLLEPVLDGAVIALHQNGYRETGGAAALISYAQDHLVETTTLGLRAEGAPFDATPVVLRGFLGWRHTYGDANPAATLSFVAGSAPFISSGAPIDRNALAAEAGVGWRASNAMTFGLSYAGQIGPHEQDHSVKGRVDYKF